jgi:hypothetical protein
MGLETEELAEEVVQMHLPLFLIPPPPPFEH